MVRPPSFDSNGMKKGAWSQEEDDKLRSYVLRYGHWNWRLLPKYAGLARCGKSCRLRWVNYLKPGLKRGNLSKEEQDLIIQLHAQLGNKWSTIASKLPGRTDNEIKNFWHTRMEKHMKHKNKQQQQQHKRKSSASKKLQLAVKVHTTSTDDDDDGASSFKAVGHHHPELIRPEVGNNPIQPEQLQHYYSRQTQPANHVIIDTYNKAAAEASDHQQLKNSATKGDTWPDISPPNDTNSSYSPGPNGYCFTFTQPDIAAAAGLEEEQYQFLHCIDLCTGALDYHHLWNINIGDDHGETSTVVLSDLWGPGLGF